MKSGSSVLKAIKTQRDSVLSKYQDTNTKITGVETQISELTEERVGLIGKLAITYLPELDYKKITETAPEIRAAVQNEIAKKQESRASLNEKIAQNETEREQFKASIDRTSVELEKVAQERLTLESEVARTLQLNEHYTTEKARAEAAKTRLERNEARFTTFSEKSKQLTAEYQNNKLFAYLIKIGYDAKKSFGIRGAFNNIVARAAKFEENIQKYNRLTTLPQQMETVLNDRRESLNQQLAQLRKIEEEVEDQVLLAPVYAHGDALDNERKKAAANLKTHDDEYEGFVTELKELDSTKSQFYINAVNAEKKFLGSIEISALKTKARATPGSEDDAIVGRLEEIDAKIRNDKDDSKTYASIRDTKNIQHAELKRLEAGFVNAGYNSELSEFDRDFDITQLILNYLMNRDDLRRPYSIEDVWRETKRHHHIREIIEETYTPSFPSPPLHRPTHSAPSFPTHTPSPPSHNWGGTSFGGGASHTVSRLGGGGSRTVGGFGGKH